MSPNIYDPNKSWWIMLNIHFHWKDTSLCVCASPSSFSLSRLQASSPSHPVVSPSDRAMCWYEPNSHQTSPPHAGDSTTHTHTQSMHDTASLSNVNVNIIGKNVVLLTYIFNIIIILLLKGIMLHIFPFPKQCVYLVLLHLIPLGRIGKKDNIIITIINYIYIYIYIYIYNNNNNTLQYN